MFWCLVCGRWWFEAGSAGRKVGCVFGHDLLQPFLDAAAIHFPRRDGQRVQPLVQFPAGRDPVAAQHHDLGVVGVHDAFALGDQFLVALFPGPQADEAYTHETGGVLDRFVAGLLGARVAAAPGLGDQAATGIHVGRGEGGSGWFFDQGVNAVCVTCRRFAPAF